MRTGMTGDEPQHLPPMPSPGPQRREPEGLADSRDAHDVEALRQDQIQTTEIPLRTPPRPTGTGYPQVGRDTPATPFPPPRHDTTEPFGAVLAVPGQNTTQCVPAEGGDPQLKTTAGFGGVLPLPASTGPTPPSVLQPGATVGAFTLEACLESGATFTVYRARHVQHGEVNLEVMTEAAVPHAQAFLLEARLRTTLSDGRLVKILGLGASPRPWLAVEAVAANTLAEVFERGPVSPQRLARIVIDVAGALEHAHSRRVVHGDL